MPLIKPLPGDLADRQSILELKISHSNVEEFDSDDYVGVSQSKGQISRVKLPKGSSNPRTMQFLDEHQGILNAISLNFTLDKQNDQKFVDKYDALYGELAETNKQLWELEDKIRELRKAPSHVRASFAWMDQVRDTAFGIVDNNDKRSEIIKKINAMWGYNVQEKMY